MNDSYFIKCTNCNHLNAFKTEFVTFCEHCGKKLKNNFQEWIKNNPGKTIKDFKKEIRVTDNGHSAVKIPLKRNRYRIFVPLLIGVLVLFLVWINFAPIDLKAIYLPSKTPTAILKDNWNRSTYGKYGIAISAPEKLVKIEPNYPDELKLYLLEMESFSYRPSKYFTVFLNNTFYKEQVRLSLEGTAVGFLNGLIHTKGISNLEFKQSPIWLEDVRGIFIEGSYHESGIFMKFRSAVYHRRSNIWQVITSYKYDDEVANKVAEKILDSIEISAFVQSI